VQRQVIRLHIIYRYVFREIVVSFLFAFAVLLVAGLIAGFLPLLQKGMESGLELTLILFQVLASALPGTLVTVLPLSMMIGILLGLGRMAADNEVAALRSAGISVLRLLPPVILLGAFGCALSFACTLFLIPRGIAEGKRLMQHAATQRADAGLDERSFFDSLQNLIIYVDGIDRSTGLLTRVFIRESSQPNEITTIMSQKGKLVPDPEGKALILDLRNGTILKEDRQGDSTGQLAFETYVFRFSLPKPNEGASAASFEELPIAEILARLRIHDAQEVKDTPAAKAYYRRVQLFSWILIIQRFTHPLACLALAFAAFPLGVLNLGKSRLNNVSLGLVVIFIFYAFTLATERMARSDLAPPALVLPLPSLLFIVGATYFSRCVEQERYPRVLVRLKALISRAR
jgi:lipopolysaccharide export system permease protein